MIFRWNLDCVVPLLGFSMLGLKPVLLAWPLWTRLLSIAGQNYLQSQLPSLLTQAAVLTQTDMREPSTPSLLLFRFLGLPVGRLADTTDWGPECNYPLSQMAPVYDCGIDHFGLPESELAGTCVIMLLQDSYRVPSNVVNKCSRMNKPALVIKLPG